MRKTFQIYSSEFFLTLVIKPKLPKSRNSKYSKHLNKLLLEQSTENELYSKCQHGFRKKRSCITQLIEVHDKLTELIDNGKSIDIVYLD